MSVTPRGRLEILADAETFGTSPEPFGVIAGHDDSVLVCDVANHRIWRLSRGAAPEVLVGCGEAGNDGDGRDGREVRIDRPYEVRLGQGGEVLFVDMSRHVVRCLMTDGTVTTLAGSGEPGFSGDGGDARLARLQQPHSIALDGAGSLYIADIANHRVRRVAGGTIETVMGTGEQAPTRIGARAAGNPVNGPRALAFDPSGRMWLVLREGNAVLRVEDDGRVAHVAGTGRFGYSGDDGPAAEARLAGPKGIALTPAGGCVIADTESHTVRHIDVNGTITTLAGNGEAGDSLDPREACVSRPHGVDVTLDGDVLIGDSDNHRVLRLVGAALD